MTPLPQPELNTAPPHADDASDWHTRSIDEALEHLAAESHGLSTADADRRRITYGANELEATSRESAWRILAAQFQNVLILILLAGTLVSGFLGHTLEAVVITVIVLLAVCLGFIQEHRAGRALEALKAMAAPTARVLRDGTESVIPARELVPGDVVILRAGDRVPADARVMQA
ncbi:MAG TPA: cation-transporting P-type ATPase, partial [Vicinamibacterales bacterium]|nr:cation-transporting P-type ATPase [Vicinamibacterales bacterium]